MWESLPPPCSGLGSYQDHIFSNSPSWRPLGYMRREEEPREISTKLDSKPQETMHHYPRQPSQDGSTAWRGSSKGVGKVKGLLDHKGTCYQEPKQLLPPHLPYWGPSGLRCCRGKPLHTLVSTHLHAPGREATAKPNQEARSTPSTPQLNVKRWRPADRCMPRHHKSKAERGPAGCPSPCGPGEGSAFQ